MNIEIYAGGLRKLLDVSDVITTDDILDLIKTEGWEPHPFSEEVEDRTLWACPVTRGIFGTIERNDATGQMGYVGSPTEEIATLEGLRKARLIPGLEETWEFIISTDISDDEVQDTANQLTSGSMSLVVSGADKPTLLSCVSQSIEKWKPNSVAQRQTYLAIFVAFLASLSGLSNCRSKPTHTVINNFTMNLGVQNKPQNPQE